MLAKDAERTGKKRCRLCWVKEDERAAADLEQQAAENPGDPGVHYQLAAKYIILTRYDEAYRAAKKAIELGMDDDRGYGMLGRVCVESGRMEEGRDASLTSFKINSDNPISSINLAVYYSVEGNFEMAMDYFDIAKKLAPDSHRLFGERGLHYARVGMISEALHDLGKAIELQPCNQDYYHNMSEIYMKNGETGEAKKVLEMSIENRPACAESFHVLSRIYMDEGLLDTALENIEKALEVNPDTPEFLATKDEILEKSKSAV